jgi:hypothetical protein
LPLPPLVSNAIFSLPPPRLSLQRRLTLPPTPPPPLNPVFIVHRHHLVLHCAGLFFAMLGIYFA